MRYRAEAAQLPDGLYAIWDGRIFPAQRSTTDATMLLTCPREQPAPEGFDAEYNGSPAKVVPESETALTFSLQTYCLFAQEAYRIAAVPETDSGELVLQWAGDDPQLAAQLGLNEFTTTASWEDLDALWQERHDFPESASPRTEPGSGDSAALLRAIGQVLLGLLPEGTQRASAQFRQIGDYSELEVRALVSAQAERAEHAGRDSQNGQDPQDPKESQDSQNEVTVSLAAPAQLGQLFSQVRSAMYESGSGTWFQGTFTLNSASAFDFDFDSDVEPSWALPPAAGVRTPARVYQAELEYFPRPRVRIPAWLAAKAALPLDLTFRQPQVIDGFDGGRPVANRVPLPSTEARGVLEYLYRAPVALALQTPQSDIFTPGTPPDVPHAFHTDGSWIWPAAVPHYLRKYGLPPDPDLLEHIRACSYRPPYVEELTRATAEAELLGKPYPRQSAHESGEHDPVTQVERGEVAEPRLRGGEVLQVLHRRLAEQGVPHSAYRIGEAGEGAWCLRRTDHGWEVARHHGGPRDPVYFTDIADAAQFLLGTLLLVPARTSPDVHAEHEDSTASGEGVMLATPAQSPSWPSDWPMSTMQGEPPLSFYRDKRLIVLPRGRTLRRFGHEGSNLAHAESTRFAETSLPAEWAREHHEYRVLRPLRVLTASSPGRAGLPGGAIAYLLPQPIATHVETGALERLS